MKLSPITVPFYLFKSIEIHDLHLIALGGRNRETEAYILDENPLSRHLDRDTSPAPPNPIAALLDLPVPHSEFSRIPGTSPKIILSTCCIVLTNASF